LTFAPIIVFKVIVYTNGKVLMTINCASKRKSHQLQLPR